jgi:hypothetical protein
VYLGERKLSRIRNKRGKSARVKLRVDGKVVAIAVPKLVAMTYVPNPHNHTHIILIDRSKENYHANNIRWVCSNDCIRYNQRCIDIEELSEQLFTSEDEANRATALPIPGYKNYRITPNGKVFYGQRRLHASRGTGNRAARVKLRDAEGNSVRIVIAKLVALAFIPNPDNYGRIIFKDRDNNHCTVDNIQWVSNGEFIRFVNHHAENDNLLGPPRPKRKPDWIDPERVPLQGYPGYYITKAGGSLSPVEVANINNKLYVINGHHRLEAALRTNTEVKYKILSKEQWQTYGYKDESQILNASSEASQQRIKLDSKIIRQTSTQGP